MTSLMRRLSEELAGASGLDAATVASLLTEPPDPSLGDYALPAFIPAEKLGRKPGELASEWASRILPSELISSARAVGPYVNLSLSRPKLAELVLSEIVSTGQRYGHSGEGAGRTVVIDYSSPNVAKRLGVYLLRTTVIGYALYKLYQALGYNCVGINHLGDWGAQFGRLIAAYEMWGDEQEFKRDAVGHLNALYVRHEKAMEEDPKLEDGAREIFGKLEAGDERYYRMWERFRDVGVEEFKQIYRRLGVRFDHYIGESYYAGRSKELVDRLLEKGVAKASEGAVIVDLSPYGMPPLLVRRSNGSYLYQTRDLCAAEDRHRRFNFSKMIYVVGSGQNLHFRQVFKVLELMGHEWAKDCVHVEFGVVRFEEGKMSTRKGRLVLLTDVLDRAVELAREITEEKNPNLKDRESIAEAVGIGAVIFADFKARRGRDVLFKWEDVLSFDGETGPYVQYTHVRLCGILRNYKGEPVRRANWSLLTEPQEAALIRKLEAYGGNLRRAAESYELSTLASYLIELSSLFNAYYHDHRVLTDNEELTRARVLLVDCVRQVMRSGLEILCMEPLEEM